MRELIENRELSEGAPMTYEELSKKQKAFLKKLAITKDRVENVYDGMGGPIVTANMFRMLPPKLKTLGSSKLVRWVEGWDKGLVIALEGDYS